MLKTFSIQALGCRVNQYEAEQIATLLRSHGLTPSEGEQADVKVVHTCSVTVQAAAKSRQSARQASSATRISLPQFGSENLSAVVGGKSGGERSRVIVTGCWATSDPTAASTIAGKEAVITNHENLAGRIAELLESWGTESTAETSQQAGQPTQSTTLNKSSAATIVNKNPARATPEEIIQSGSPVASATKAQKAQGATTLPLLGQRQTGRQRAYLKIQDGCDAHCTYCIIPKLRPIPWSKPLDETIKEAKRLVDAGHVEIVLTGIFLGAYGQPTALRRRQPHETAGPLAQLVDTLCTNVPGMKRLRLSSLEPGDLTPDLIAALRSHEQVVPHFHLPLQSGSDALLRRMNRQYTRGEFLTMLDRVRAAFDRPAFTTDIIVGFPGETDEEFTRTLQVVDAAGFIHTHAFSYSARPGTAAARWNAGQVSPAVAKQRIAVLRDRAAAHSLAFRKQFVGQTAAVLIERQDDPADRLRHGRSERYFNVYVDGAGVETGQMLKVRIDRVDEDRSLGTVINKGGQQHRAEKPFQNSH